ncbi:MAG: TIM barrel protein [Ardenticatenaceae bacterium]
MGEAIDYEQMLDELVATGYEGTELGDWGYMPTDAGRLRAELAERGLALLGAFVPVALKEAAAHAAGESHALRVARLLAEVGGTRSASLAAESHRPPFLVLADDSGTEPVRTQNAGRITPAHALSREEWQLFTEGAARIARAVRTQTGLDTVFHHHCAGYVETPDEIATLLDQTDPALLGLVFDTGHYLYGSGTSNPKAVMEGLERFADRTWHIHFKDLDPVVAARARLEGWDYFQAIRHGLFCELGQGVVDCPAVLAWLQARGYDGWIVVEQDVLPGMGTPKESALRNREYLETVMNL